MTQLTENQICYWLIVGIILGAGIMAVFMCRYIYDITVENTQLKRENDRITAYLDYKQRNALSLGD